MEHCGDRQTIKGSTMRRPKIKMKMECDQSTIESANESTIIIRATALIVTQTNQKILIWITVLYCVWVAGRPLRKCKQIKSRGWKDKPIGIQNPDCSRGHHADPDFYWTCLASTSHLINTSYLLNYVSMSVTNISPVCGESVGTCRREFWGRKPQKTWKNPS